MENLLPKMPGGYIGVRLTPPLNNIFPKPPKVLPPPEKYYAATQICTSKSGTMTLNGHILSSSNTMNTNTMKASSNHSNTNSNGSNTTASLDGRNVNGCITPTTPLNHHQLSSYSDFDTLLMDDEALLKEFPRDKLVIVEKLGCGVFGELHLCETKGLT
jgi:discoidin domain receptor family member 2